MHMCHQKKSDFSSRFLLSFYLVVRTPPLPLLSRQTGPDRSPENSSWSLRCQWSGKLQKRDEEEKNHKLKTGFEDVNGSTSTGEI